MRAAAPTLSRNVMVLALLVVASLLGACGGDDEPASGRVVLYTSIPDDVVDRIEGIVEQRFPDLEGNYWLPLDNQGISLTVVRGRTADIESRIADEISQGRIRADLIWLAEPSPYEAYKELGLLASIEPPAEAPIPPEYIDEDGFYVAGRVISMVVAWNTSLLPEGLTDWPDLLGVGSAAFPAPASGAARATIKALTDEFGQEFFATLVDGGGESVPSNGDARDGVVAGGFEAVGVLDYMMREAMSSGAKVAFAYPASGTVLIPSPIAITADSQNPSAARAVADFILSQPGQEIIVEIGGFYPARTDVDPPDGAPPLGTIATLPVDWNELGEEVVPIANLWESLFGTPDAGASSG